MYRFLIQKKVQEKNKKTRNLSISVLEKFNGYEMIRKNLTRKEKIEFTPINIIYESVFDEKIPVRCFFINLIHLAYKSYFSRFDEGVERILNRVVRQCHYCQNFFVKNDENMKKILDYLCS